MFQNMKVAFIAPLSANIVEMQRFLNSLFDEVIFFESIQALNCCDEVYDLIVVDLYYEILRSDDIMDIIRGYTKQTPTIVFNSAVKSDDDLDTVDIALAPFLLEDLNNTLDYIRQIRGSEN